MNSKNEELWHVAVEQRDGHLEAHRQTFTLQTAIQALQTELAGPMTFVQFPKGAMLRAVTASDHGQLPPGVVPLISEVEEALAGNRKSVSVIWLCLGYLVPTSESKGQIQNSTDQESGDIRRSSGSNRNEEAAAENATEGQDARGNSDFITVKQRRFLFRLLAQQDIKGQKAENYIKKALSVENLNEASKKDASGLIDKLMDQGGEGT